MHGSLLYPLDDGHIFYILNSLDWWEIPRIEEGEGRREGRGGEQEGEQEGVRERERERRL